MQGNWQDHLVVDDIEAVLQTVVALLQNFDYKVLSVPTIGARVGAVAQLRLLDYRNLGDQRTLHFREKGGKDREFLSGTISRLGCPTNDAHSLRQMLKRTFEGRQFAEVVLAAFFPRGVVTDLLKQDVPLEDVQYLAGHSQPEDNADL